MSDLIEAMEPGAPDADAQAQGPLGDTDLVEAILTDPAGLRALALRLMIEQTHWSDLALTERDLGEIDQKTKEQLKALGYVY